MFPLSDDEQLLAHITTEQFLAKRQLQTCRNFTALCFYNDPIIKAAVHCNKFHHHTKSRQLLTALLSSHLASTSDILILPIPLSRTRERRRGYNQVTEVLKVGDLPYDDSLLVRVRDTKPQMSLKRSERLTNVAQAFGLRDRTTAQKRIAGRHIIILDDVVTTGATLNAAAAVLRPLSPASLTCLALAH